MDNLFQPRWRQFQRFTVRQATAHRQTPAQWLALNGPLGSLRVSAVADGLFRLQVQQRPLPDYGILQEISNAEASLEQEPSSARLTTGQASLALDFNEELTLRLFWNGQALTESARDGHFTQARRLPPLGIAPGGETWVLSLELDHEERLYGGGEKWASLNRRGRLLSSRAEDALGVNGELSYKNCPFIWSPRGWGVFVHTPGDVHHGCGNPRWSTRAYVAAIEDPNLDLFLFAAEGAQGLIDRYHTLSGKPAAVPYWSLGIWMSTAYYKTPEAVLETAQALRQRHIPCDVITLDGRAWQDTDTRFAFEWDPHRYPDPKGFTEQLHALDFRICAWEYPLVSKQNPLFARLDAKGWLLKDALERTLVYEWDPEPFGEVLTPLPASGLLDFTHPEAYAYWRDAHEQLFASGIDVIKTDFGEQVPDEAVAANGDSGKRLHNAYPLLYNRAVYEASQRYGQSSPALVFGRSGWAGSQRYPTQWGGDPQADWGGLAASLRGMLSQALSGNPFYAHDIGGFYGDRRDAELYLRWVQAGVFASHMRFHGIGAREPWSYGTETSERVLPFLRLRYQLLPYIYAALEKGRVSGVALCRPMVLAFPDYPESWSFDLQYLFGESLLVAPVVRPQGEARYYLPQGDWVDFWSEQPVSGGQIVESRVPLYRLPLFVKAGHRLALGPAVRSTSETGGQPQVVEIRHYNA